MTYNFRLWENLYVADLLAPAVDDVGLLSAYYSLTSAIKAYVKVHITQASATPVVISLLQDIDSTGGIGKAIGIVPIVANEDTATADGFVIKPNAATYTTSATTKSKLIIFEVDPAQALDVQNKFNHLAVSTGSGSDVTNIVEASLILVPKDKMLHPRTALI